MYLSEDCNSGEIPDEMPTANLSRHHSELSSLTVESQNTAFFTIILYVPHSGIHI